MITITQNKGFHLEFENGITISVQIGAGNYCDNYNEEFGFEKSARKVSSSDAEIAIWDRENNWFVFDGGDTVKGRVTTSDLVEWIERSKIAKDIKSL
jgi:hypothetical protein